jgi:NOL1/NOP2/fmu family ribosome biogenesis protein
VAATNYDGRQIPEDENYDKILVDAPCSGEADRARRGETASLGEIKGLAELQKQLAVKAANLLKEGGKMVYSTCTFAPEENEEVVKHVLEETDLELERAETGAEHVRGVTEFEDQKYGEEMKKTIRVYPHHLNSGGMYIAKFVKPQDSLDQVKSSISSSSESEVEKAWNYIGERFGVEKADLEGFSIKRVAGDYWLVSEQGDTRLEVETYGFRFVRITGRGLKPTTYALQFLGDRISKNIVELDKQEFLDLLNREEMVPREMDEKGYVALRFEGQIVGCGYYMNETVSSRIPKGRGNELAGILD